MWYNLWVLKEEHGFVVSRNCSKLEVDAVINKVRKQFLATPEEVLRQKNERAAQAETKISKRQREQRTRGRFNAFMERKYGGLKASKSFLSQGPTCAKPIARKLPPEEAPNFDNARPLPAYQSRKFKPGQKAWRKYKLYSKKFDEGIRYMPNAHANWNLHHCGILRRTAVRLKRIEEQTMLRQTTQELTEKEEPEPPSPAGSMIRHFLHPCD